MDAVVTPDVVDFTYTNDVIYNEDSEEFLQMSYHRILTIPLNLSTSESGNTEMIHSLVSNPPSWVWVDYSDNTLKIDTSKGYQNIRYDFDIITTVPPSTWKHTKRVSLLVKE